MKLEVFEAIVSTIIDQTNKCSKLMELGIETYTYDSGYVGAITLLLRAYYGEEGEDLISWYIYNRECSDHAEKPKLVNKTTGEEICYDVNSLWRTVEEMRVSNDFVEYELPKKTELSEEKVMSILKHLFKGKL